MKTSPVTDIRLLMRLLTGDPVESMEAAKAIIGKPKRGVGAILRDIAANPLYRRWTRIGAVYAMGLLPYRPGGKMIMEIVEASHEPLSLRCHAAEALGNIQDRSAVAGLERMLLDDSTNTKLRKWSIYALSQIRTASATRALRTFTDTCPKGVLKNEVEWALEPEKRAAAKTRMESSPQS